MLFGDEQGLRFATSEDLRHWRLLDEPPLNFDGLHRPASPYLFWHGGKLWLFFAAERDGQQGIFCVAG
jgi:beta-xylosidase